MFYVKLQQLVGPILITGLSSLRIIYDVVTLAPQHASYVRCSLFPLGRAAPAPSMMRALHETSPITPFIRTFASLNERNGKFIKGDRDRRKHE